MEPIEIINTIVAKRITLMNQSEPDKKHEEYVFIDPDQYEKGTDRRLKIINGRYHQVGKDEYIKDFIIAFILNVQALNYPDLIKGYQEAQKTVYTKYGFGPVDDVYLTLPGNSKESRYRIRIWSRGDISKGELNEIAVFSQFGEYVLAKNINDFYAWYVKTFGEILI